MLIYGSNTDVRVQGQIFKSLSLIKVKEINSPAAAYLHYPLAGTVRKTIFIYASDNYAALILEKVNYSVR
jgi:hypothetical protein